MRRRGDWVPVARQRGIEQIVLAFLDAVRAGQPLSARDALRTHELCERVVPAALGAGRLSARQPRECRDGHRRARRARAVQRPSRRTGRTGSCPCASGTSYTAAALAVGAQPPPTRSPRGAVHRADSRSAWRAPSAAASPRRAARPARRAAPAPSCPGTIEVEDWRDQHLRPVPDQMPAHVGERRLEADQRTDPQPSPPSAPGITTWCRVPRMPVLARRLAHRRRPAEQRRAPGCTRRTAPAASCRTRSPVEAVRARPGHRALVDAPRPAGPCARVDVDQQVGADRAGQRGQPGGQVAGGRPGRDRRCSRPTPPGRGRCPARRAGELLAARRTAARGVAPASTTPGWTTATRTVPAARGAGPRPTPRPGRARTPVSRRRPAAGPAAATSSASAVFTATTSRLTSHTPPTEASRSAGGTCHWLAPSSPHGPPELLPGPDQLDHQPAGRHRTSAAAAARPADGPAQQLARTSQPPRRPQQHRAAAASTRMKTCRLGSSQ